jgi:hypothetical protein
VVWRVERVRTGKDKGGRKEALKHALGANAANGLRRSTADKQRAIEVCAKEFPELTQAKIAEMVGCSRSWVSMVTNQFVSTDKLSLPATRTGIDGKQYPTNKTRNPSTIAQDEPEADPLPDTWVEDADAAGVTEGARLLMRGPRP